MTAADDHAKVAIALAAYAGLRASEVIGLPWSNVNLETDLLFVREAITHSIVVTPRCGRSERTLPRLAGHGHLSVTQRYAHTNAKLMHEAGPGLRHASAAARE